MTLSLCRTKYCKQLDEVNNELEIMLKEVVMAQYEILSWNMLRKPEGKLEL